MIQTFQEGHEQKLSQKEKVLLARECGKGKKKKKVVPLSSELLQCDDGLDELVSCNILLDC